QTAQHVEFRIAGRVVGPPPTPEPPAHSFHGGQGPHPVVLDLETILRRVERLRRHRQHRRDLRKHPAVLPARFRDAFTVTAHEASLPWPALTLCCSASNSGRIVCGGAVVASAGCPASLASIKVFSSCAP